MTGATLREPQYARVPLAVRRRGVSGTWNQLRVEGRVAGSKVLRLTLRRSDGKTGGRAHRQSSVERTQIAGDGNMEIRRRGGAAAREAGLIPGVAGPPKRAGGSEDVEFEPKEFYSNYSAAIAPVLRVFPGDTMRTWTIDSGGLDSKLTRGPRAAIPRPGPSTSRVRCPATPWWCI